MKTIVLWVLLQVLLLHAYCAEPANDDFEERIRAQIGMDLKDYFRENFFVQLVEKTLRRGLPKEAVEEADGYLLTDPGNRFVRCLKATINEQIGKIPEAEADLDYLIREFPAFKPAYFYRARLMLHVPKPVDGKLHPLLDWLNSPEPDKKEAAQAVVLNLISEHHLQLTDTANAKDHPPLLSQSSIGGLKVFAEYPQGAKASVTDAVEIRIGIKNATKEPVHYLRPSLFRNLRISIEKEDGRNVLLTALGVKRSVPEGGIVSARGGSLDPGESIGFNVTLSRYFDLSLPGKYNLRVEYRAGGDEGKWETIFLDVPFELTEGKKAESGPRYRGGKVDAEQKPPAQETPKTPDTGERK
jgi:hypothetical protein